MQNGLWGGIKIEMLNKTNYYVWKQKLKLLLTYREADEVAEKGNPHAKESEEHIEWNQRDKLARALIGLRLLQKVLKNLRNCRTAKQMLSNINSIFKCSTRLNKMRAPRGLHTVEMKSWETTLSYINRLQELGSILKSMEVKLGDQEVAMAVLCGLPLSYARIVTTLDALSGDSATFKLVLVESHPLQEE